jgi:hypothetical protein
VELGGVFIYLFIYLFVASSGYSNEEVIFPRDFPEDDV